MITDQVLSKLSQVEWSLSYKITTKRDLIITFSGQPTCLVRKITLFRLADLAEIAT